MKPSTWSVAGARHRPQRQEQEQEQEQRQARTQRRRAALDGTGGPTYGIGRQRLWRSSSRHAGGLRRLGRLVGLPSCADSGRVEHLGQERPGPLVLRVAQHLGGAPPRR